MTRKQKDIVAVGYTVAAISFFTACTILGAEQQAEPTTECCQLETERMELFQIKEVAPVQPVSTEGTEFDVEDYVSIDDEELMLLARLIYAEAGGVKDDKCLYYVGSVVLNRVKDEDYPDTIEGVIFQTEPCIQYGCARKGYIAKEPDERCIEIAEELLVNGSVLPANVVYQSGRKQGSGVYEQIENVVFCYK